MTETEWVRSTDPHAMLPWVCGKVSRRKLRLLACAFCRQVFHLIRGERWRKALPLAEEAADRHSAYCPATKVAANPKPAPEPWPVPQGASSRAVAVAVGLALGVGHMRYVLAEVRQALESEGRDKCDRLPPRGRRAYRRAERARWCGLIRDVAGNPFRRVRFDRTWRTPLILNLARTMYEERDFSALPVLADALEDVGCEDPELLAHCRGPGPHVRGCWAVDALLGRS